MINKFPVGLVLLILATTPVMACDLKVSDAWIREAPPGLMTLAGYAILANQGDKPLRIVKVQSSVFTEVQMHESRIDKGIASMHAIDAVDIAPHQSATFAPSGKHFMMMGAKQALKKGSQIQVQLQDQSGCVTSVSFVVRAVSE